MRWDVLAAVDDSRANNTRKNHHNNKNAVQLSITTGQPTCSGNDGRRQKGVRNVDESGLQTGEIERFYDLLVLRGLQILLNVTSITQIENEVQ